ncbi:E3 ubiquitin protein ligase DRIP2-like isoform X1 [Dendrobium catenatum]|uniref:E3 ubiquitin protein ligase DRIP2 n=1 Tax=Dendrobium catenatum TaxID=906689 RepID=A0A2I0W907_9ASPA|nr:E3 ubiquitin protein ligase DRIP2-like isoform X1 [Dendrobium catenatum]PKU72140.1 E3 ubiquitin protein ligase DRIP2 [Dendrobium catenatum]
MANAEESIAPPQEVRVQRKLLLACMTCPLCHKLLRDATAISECLHTFCRKCIFDNLADEDADCCPICNIDLGCVPLEKLRPDHNLEDIRTKIFPYKRRKVNAPEALPLMTLPIRRKERSLSSLVVDTPRIGTQTGLLGRRTKAAARKASTLQGLSPLTDEHAKKDADNSEHLTDNSSKMSHCRRQNSSNGVTSNHTPSNDSRNSREIFVDKSSLQTQVTIKTEKTVGFADDGYEHKVKVRSHPSKPKFQDAKNSNASACSVAVKARRMHGVIRKRKVLRPSAQAVLDAADVGSERRISPIWLSLVSLHEGEGDTTLPQISASYLRIREGNLPVTFLQKYLVKKLNLASEAEVEIACRGQPVNPALSLQDLTDQWLSQGPSQRIQASVGTSAKEFVMVLTYSQKPMPP